MSKHSSRGTTWTETRRFILSRDGHICGYCGQDANTVDHIIPKAKGGGDDPANLIACCVPCNSRKQDRTYTRTTWVNTKWLDRV